VIAHYVAETRRRGVEPVVAELVALIADLEAVGSMPDADALDHAEALGEDAEAITTDGRLVAHTDEESADEGDGAPELPTDGWHVIGTLAPEPVRCSGCGARYPADEDAAELPTCPCCGTPDTWEARQPAAYRALLAAIDAAPTRAALGRRGRRLYAMRLPRGQAGVAGGRWKIREATLEPVGPNRASPHVPSVTPAFTGSGPNDRRERNVASGATACHASTST
jgi:hypothetical protein